MTPPRDADTVPPEDFGDPPNVGELTETQAEVLEGAKTTWADWLTDLYFGDDS